MEVQAILAAAGSPDLSWKKVMWQLEIRIEGHLDESWAEWLNGFTLTHKEQNETILTGPVQDQSALYGTIAKLRDLGVKLIAVNYQEQQSSALL